MRIRLNLRWLLVPAVLLSLQFCRANNLTFNFDTNSIPLWDLSGSYSLNLPVQEPNGDTITVTLGFIMRQDAAGNLHGAVNDIQGMILDQNSTFAVTYRIVGKVTGSDLGPIAHFVIFFSGFGGSSEQPQGHMSATLSVDATIDQDFLTLDPITPIRFVARLPQASVRGIVPLDLDPQYLIPLPPGEDGSWSLNLQFDTFNRVVGSAIITTPSQSLGFQLFGVLRNEEYTLRIFGAADVPGTVSGVGSRATILLPFDVSTVDSLNGKIMGQRLSF